MEDPIYRKAAIDALHTWFADGFDEDRWWNSTHVLAVLEGLPSAEQWIPIKTRPMDDEERQYYKEVIGWDLEDPEAVMFDCIMPGDGQEVWLCSRHGYVFTDTCVIDEGIGLEGNGDWDDIVAWMPYRKPEPYKGGENETGQAEPSGGLGNSPKTADR